MMPTWTVYMISHRASGKRYIGITKQGLATRWNAHKNGVKLERFLSHPLYVALREHGAEAFDTSIIATTMCLEKAGMLEDRYIKEHKALHPNGFNIIPGGVRGYAAGKRSDEFRKSCSERAKKQFANPAQRERVRQEQKARWADDGLAKSYKEGRARTMKERPELADKAREALAKGRATRKRFSGWRLSDKTRAKMRERALAQRDVMSARAKAAWENPEGRAKLLASRSN